MDGKDVCQEDDTDGTEKAWAPSEDLLIEDQLRVNLVIKHRLEEVRRNNTNESNLNASWEDDTFFSTTKKSDGKKERNINRAQRVIGRLKRFQMSEKDALLKELDSLDLSMHTTEICSAICEHITFKPKDTLEFMDVISTLHVNLKDFPTEFERTLVKSLNNLSSQILTSTIVHVHQLHKDQFQYLQLLGVASQSAAGLEPVSSSPMINSSPPVTDDAPNSTNVFNADVEEAKRRNLLLLHNFQNPSNEAISSINKRKQLWRLLAELVLSGILDSSLVTLDDEPGSLDDPPSKKELSVIVSYMKGLCAKDNDLIKPILSRVTGHAQTAVSAVLNDPTMSAFLVSPIACQSTAWVTMRFYQVHNINLLQIIVKRLGLQLIARVNQPPGTFGAVGYYPRVRLKEVVRVQMREHATLLLEDTTQKVVEDLCQARTVMESVSLRLQVNRGRIPAELVTRYSTIKELVDRVVTHGRQIAQVLGYDQPDCVVREPEEADVTRIDIPIAADNLPSEEKSIGLWDDLYQHEFYENTPNLSMVVPSALLYGKGGRKEGEEATKTKQYMDDGFAAPLEVTSGSEAVLAVSIEEVDDLKEATPKASAFGIFLVELEQVIESTNFVEDSRDLDRTASQFFLRGLNTRQNRKRLVKHIQNIRKQDIHVIPAYCRVVRTIDNYCSGTLGSDLCTFAMNEFLELLNEKNPAKQEAKIKVCHMIAELTKFTILAPGLTMNCLNRLIDDLNQSQTLMVCSLINNCGRYLMLSPGTAPRFISICHKLKRLSISHALHEELQIMIQDCLFQLEQIKLGNRCNTAASIYERAVLEMDPEHRYIQYLLTVLLMDDNVESGPERVGREDRALAGDVTRGGGPVHYVLRHLLLLDWDAVRYSWLRSIIIRREGASGMSSVSSNLYVPIYGLKAVARLMKLWQQSGMHSWVVAQLNGDLIEAIMQGCEVNDFKSLPQRVQHVKLLGEIFNQKVVKFGVVMDILYYLMYFGGAEGYSEASGPLQTRTILHRYGVICPGDEPLEAIAPELRREGMLPAFPPVRRNPVGEVIHTRITAAVFQNRLKPLLPIPTTPHTPSYQKYQTKYSEPKVEDILYGDNRGLSLNFGSVDSPDDFDGVRFPPFINPDGLAYVDIDKDDSRIKLCCAMLEIMEPSSSIARTLKLNRFFLFFQRFIMIQKRLDGVPQMIRTLFDDLCHRLLPSKQISQRTEDDSFSPGSTGTKLSSTGKVEHCPARMFRSIANVDEAICKWLEYEALAIKSVYSELKESSSHLTPVEDEEDDDEVQMPPNLISEEIGYSSAYLSTDCDEPSDNDQPDEEDEDESLEDNYGYDDESLDLEDGRNNTRSQEDNSEDSSSESSADSLDSFERELTKLTLESVEQSRIMSITGRIESRAMPSILPSLPNGIRHTDRGVTLNLLTRKGAGNKTKLFEIDVPSESKLVTAWEKRNEKKDEEKQKLKQFVYESLDRHLMEEHKEAQRDITSGVMVHPTTRGGRGNVIGLTHLSRGGGAPMSVTGANSLSAPAPFNNTRGRGGLNKGVRGRGKGNTFG
eukprot:GHVH01011636.1.p1 GENE.GHVH01011636.1~~GHVH01011636.1.p1  ORF type:complete len:1542 (+),score=292.39 GHVH01011636.1:1559-6184(+)